MALSWASVAAAQAGDSCPLRKEIGQLFVVEMTTDPATFKKHASDLNLGGVFLMSESLSSLRTPNDVVRFTNSLQQGMQTGMFIAVDQEGGMVQRLNHARGYTHLPPAETVGEATATRPKLANELGRITGEELAATGVNMNFAPVADLSTNKSSPVIAELKRAFSDDPKTAGKIAAEVIDGIQGAGVIATAKHFPGHGDTEGDSHSGEVSTRKPWSNIVSTDALPFLEAINHGVGAVMSGHILVPGLCDPEPASLNKFLLTDILRKKWGFKGLIITDDLTMGGITSRYSIEDAATKAILAGNDLLVLRGGSEQQVIEHLCQLSSEDTEEGKLLSARIAESYDRILSTKRRFHVDPPNILPAVKTISWKEHQQVVNEILRLAETASPGPGNATLPSDASKGLRSLVGDPAK